MSKMVRQITAVAPPYPDGQRLDRIDIEYDGILPAGSVAAEDYAVEGRTVLRAAVCREPDFSERPAAEAGRTEQSGRHVMLELDICEDASRIFPLPPRGRGPGGPGGPGGPMGPLDSGKGPKGPGAGFEGPGPEAPDPMHGPGPGAPGAGHGPAGADMGPGKGPQMQGKPPMLPSRHCRPAAETVRQIRAIRTADGEVIEPWEKTSDRAVQPVIDSFLQSKYENIPYNLYVPEAVRDNAGAQDGLMPAEGSNGEMTERRLYPMVVFIPDMGPNGSDPFQTLSQGYGAVAFALPRDQELHPSFVLAPQIPSDVFLTSDNFVCAPEIETIYRLIQEIVREYPVDPEHIYYTGQSQGGMAGFELNVRYPHLFAATLAVACHWDPQKVGSCCKDGTFWMLASDGDVKAYPGMSAIAEALEKNGASVTRYHWNAKWPKEQLNEAAAACLQDGADVRFTIFDDHSVVPEGEEDNGGANHRGTWNTAYAIEALRDWLFTN